MTRPRQSSPELLLTALAAGSRSRAELQERLGISQPSMSRLARAAADKVVMLGRGPVTRYGALRSIPRLGSRIPMHRIDEQGQVHVLGELLPLVAGEFWCEFVSRSGVLHPGLPHFLADMSPQGFMGRAFANRFAKELGLPARLNDWSDDARLSAMALYGEDLSGNLVVGEESLRRFYLNSTFDVLAGADERHASYPRMAAHHLEGDHGSSAGGEQPKFTSAWRDADTVHHVIVKFSPLGDTPAAVRWRDLLRAEKLALDTLREHGHAAAQASLLEAGGRIFLEVERFDRVGANGRRGLLSLGAIDDHRFGRRDSWSQCANRMQTERMISAQEAQELVLLDTFGALIANTDRHFGNVSLFIEDFRYALAPAYDMLPMLYRPTEGGDIVLREFSPPYPTAMNRLVWVEALQMAHSYWQILHSMKELSAAFREIAATNAQRLHAMKTIMPPLA